MIHNDSMDVIDKWAVPTADRASVATNHQTPIFGVYFPSALAAPYYTTPYFTEGGPVLDLIIYCNRPTDGLSDSNVIRLRSVLVATTSGGSLSSKFVEGIDATATVMVLS